MAETQSSLVLPPSAEYKINSSFWQVILKTPLPTRRSTLACFSGIRQPHSRAFGLGNIIFLKASPDLILQYISMSLKRMKYLGSPLLPPARGTFIRNPCIKSFRPGATILGKPPTRLFWMSTIFMLKNKSLVWEKYYFKLMPLGLLRLFILTFNGGRSCGASQMSSIKPFSS